ncbi:ABC transporter ATP-binding protein [Candidatus Microgenomates bacterium]|nr:ABC transporter ATP-binding protein [Candidatus Microgenomates bacterium]
MLVVKNLIKNFGNFRAVDNLSLSIKEGQTYALIGPNGAGKTTTIKILAGLYLPDDGKADFLGKDLFSEKNDVRRLIGYIPDEPVFYPGLSGQEFLNFISALYGVSETKKKEVLTYLFDLFPLKDILGGQPESYSRGNKQKLAICSALLPEPKLLLIDEPIVGLDPQSAKAALSLFKAFTKNGGSILVSTHTLAVAEEIAGCVGIIDQGKLLAEGDLKTLRQKAKLKTAHLEEVFLKITKEADA